MYKLQLFFKWHSSFIGRQNIFGCYRSCELQGLVEMFEYHCCVLPFYKLLHIEKPWYVVRVTHLLSKPLGCWTHSKFELYVPKLDTLTTGWNHHRTQWLPCAQLYPCKFLGITGSGITFLRGAHWSHQHKMWSTEKLSQINRILFYKTVITCRRSNHFTWTTFSMFTQV